MEWITNLFLGNQDQFSGGIAHSVLILAIVVAIGIVLGKIKIKGVSLGITWILFVGIAFSHFGMRLNSDLLHFVKEFVLILFLYSIGLQVGPGFFSSFKKGGVQLNMLALAVVLLGVITTYVIHLVTGLSITTMVGIMSGAITNTPGLGAAQQAYTDITGTNEPTIALGYAVSYPMGVIGVIISFVALRHMFRINFEKQEQDVLSLMGMSNGKEARRLSVRVSNQAIFGKSIAELQKLINRDFVASRIQSDNHDVEIPTSDTILHPNDRILLVTSAENADAITTFIGEEVDIEWEKIDKHLISRRILITKSSINGRSLAQLKLRSGFGINITRVNRAGVDLLAHPALQLQMGDRVTVIGTELAISNVEKVLGNSMKRLNEPNLIPIFLGIVLGVLAGSIPFTLPGIPQALKLGLAGGPLIVSILISRFGPQYKLVTYTTMSANLMLREISISIFLACVGLGAGEGFVDTLVNQQGYIWVLYGTIITMLPVLIVGAIGFKLLKINYFTVMGVLAGSCTNAPALAFANSNAGNTMPAVGYATVYPLSTFLRVVVAQLMILFLM